jgi:hypothetical protein
MGGLIKATDISRQIQNLTCQDEDVDISERGSKADLN